MKERKYFEEKAEILMRETQLRLLLTSDKRRVFFAALAMRLTPSPSWAIPTAGVNGVEIIYNPKWWCELQIDAFRDAVLAHEIFHAALLHHLRRQERDHSLWNIAADLADNDALLEAGYVLPEYALVPGTVSWSPEYAHIARGLSAEEYYDILKSETPEGQGEGQGEGEGEDQGGGEENVSPSGSQPSEPEQAEDGDTEEDDGDSAGGEDGSSQDSNESGAGDDGEDSEDSSEGGGAGGAGDDAEEEAESGGGGAEEGEGDNAASDSSPSGGGEGSDAGDDRCDDFVDPGGMGGLIEPEFQDSAAVADEERKMKAAVRAAVDTARRVAGSEAGSFCDLVEKSMDTKTPWREILADFIVAQSRDDYSFSRPNHRVASADFIMPGLCGNSLGEIVIAIDSSGSIDQDALNLFRSEVQALVEPYDCTVHLVYHHHQIYKTEEWNPGEGEIEFGADETGGTSHMPVFEWIDENVQCPTLTICFTDLYSVFPEEPDYPVLFVSDDERHGDAPWDSSMVIVANDN